MNELVSGTHEDHVRQQRGRGGGERVKIAKYTKKAGVICFENAFTGGRPDHEPDHKVKTTSSILALHAEVYRVPYAYCYRCSYGLKYPSCNVYCADFIQEKFFDLYAAAESVGALIVEPVQGEGGFIVPPKEYLGKLQKICRDNGIVFIVDEVQTGFARTGKMFAIVLHRRTDILITAKSLAAGLPRGSPKAEIMDSVDAGGLGDLREQPVLLQGWWSEAPEGKNCGPV
jgi:4-aminobutyrate aminotransferase/(S)-3-amino-2-methylpropionate transaminase